MLKKLSLIMMACLIAFSFSAVGAADAKGSYKSPKKSFSPSTTTQTPNSGINKNEPSTSKTPAGTTNPATATKPGFFSGGLMKGLLIGGLAGMLFGGLFGNMGFLGDMMGLLVNVLAVVVIFVIIRKIVLYFREKRKLNEEPKRY